jgi:hypothetical protein
MEVWTIQMAKHRKVQSMGIELVDTTIMTGDGSPFAPTWDMVMGVKSGIISQEEYTTQYHALLQQRYRENRAAFHELIYKPRIAIACYCRAGEFCHRHLFKGVILKLAVREGLAAVDHGELV